MPYMDDPLPTESANMGNMKAMLDLLYDGLSRLVGENSKELQIGLANTRDELAFVKREVEEVKAMLQHQAELFTDFLSKNPTEEMKPEIVKVVQVSRGCILARLNLNN
jgi:hypothetical protein